MSRFDTLLHAINALHVGQPDLMEFAPPPSDFSSQDLPQSTWFDPKRVTDLQNVTPPEHTDILETLAQNFHALNWHQSYTEDEVGAEMLSRYGYIELYGPKGQFHCADHRAYLSYWGENIYYDWHHHEAEELYFILSGEAIFHKKGEEDRLLRAGDTTFHASYQPHAMTTTTQPILAFVLWRGAGLTGGLEMSTA